MCRPIETPRSITKDLRCFQWRSQEAANEANESCHIVTSGRAGGVSDDLWRWWRRGVQTHTSPYCTHTDANADANPNTHTRAHTYTSAHTNTDTYTRTYTYADTYTHANAYPSAYSKGTTRIPTT